MTLMELAQPTGLTDALVASSTSEGLATVVTFRGEADLCALPTIVEALSRAIADHDGAVIVDLTRTEFIDTRTMRALDRAWQFLDDRGRTLTLRSPSRVAVRLLTLLGLSHLIEPDQAMMGSPAPGLSPLEAGSRGRVPVVSSCSTPMT